MLGLLTGTPHAPHVPGPLILLVNDVGYQIEIAEQTKAYTQTHPIVTLYIYTHVTENTLALFGFLTREAKALFLLLLDVSGVGPKTALALTDRGVPALTSAIQTADLHFFTQIPRVGKKLGQKIIIELTSKLGTIQELDLTPLSVPQAEVQEALLALGFVDSDIAETMKLLDLDSLTTAQAVQAALKIISSRQTILH
jgi:Holliday junction DNA helicase RuvA